MTEQTATGGTLPTLDDLDEYDDDSALGSDADSSTASITSSIIRDRTLHGRTYHSERGNAQYWASNDDSQNELLDILHHSHALAMGGKLFLAPIPKGIQKAVDIGTGTGIWAIDFADEFPDIEVVGTDISPIQPGWVPPNLKFEIEDCTSDWTFDADSLDFVHFRWLIGSISDWTELFKHAYECIKPGGYIESNEPDCVLQSDDGTVVEGSAMSQWGELFKEGGRKLGRPFTVYEDEVQRKAMEEAGFVDIEERVIKVPHSPWPKDRKLKEIGRYKQLMMEKDLEGFILFVATTMGWSLEKVTVFIAKLRREIRSPKIHEFFYQRIVWGRKPA